MNELLGLVQSAARGVWRFRWLALGLAWMVSVVGWAVVSQLPDQYESEARIHVDTQSVLRPLLEGLAVQPNINQQVDMMARTLLTRPTLQQVARETDMHLEAFTEEQMEGIVDRIARGVDLSGGRDNIYTISYTDSDPRQSFRVVQAMLNVFVEGALGESRGDSESARRFLDEQIREYEQRLEAAEQRLARFRRENVDVLPGALGTYYQRLEAAQEDLRAAQTELREAQNRRNEIQRQLASGVMEERFGQSLTPAIDNRIQNAQNRLDELTLTYTDRHPDIQALRRTLEELEAEKQSQIAMLREGIRQGASHLLDDNPVYQQMRMALSTAEVDLSAREARVEEERRRVENLQRMVNRAPEVEAELQRLDRDYSVNQERYMTLLGRREQAAMGRIVEEGGDRVQFRVIEPARMPTSPSAPDRPLLFAAMLLLGLGAGGGLGFLASELRPVFDNRRALNAATGFPVLGTVGFAKSARQRAAERTGHVLFGLLLVLLLATFAGVVALGGIHLPVLDGIFG
ncbi:MAG: chain length-determining protein [Thioalkalivibrio sp.]|nr:MAG: chain length-determining protein [Thioalkalivibrio sp.]